MQGWGSVLFEPVTRCEISPGQCREWLNFAAMDHGAASVLVDGFGRVHDYLRVSLVDKCNLRCTYCMPEDIRFLPKEHLMSAEEILHLVGIFVGLGVKKVRLTGGEPLLRKDFGRILAGLAAFPVELALSTNGILLQEYLPDILASGLRSVNLSLDSLRADRVLQITRRDSLATVWASLEAAVLAGLHVKINVVVMRGVNDDEVLDFVKLTEHRNLHVRFIEFMPFDGNRWEWDRMVPHAEMLDRIQAGMEVEKLQDEVHSTSKGYRVKGWKGSFAVISTVSAPFCEGCNRIRLTAEGKIRNCLFGHEELDLLGALRSGQPVEDLIRASIHAKAERLGGLPEFSNREALKAALSPRAMVKIGG